jgi:hypothetical protein
MSDTVSQSGSVSGTWQRSIDIGTGVTLPLVLKIAET